MENNSDIMEKIKKIIVEICRLLIGIVFIFSGFVKAVDPLGSAYKFQDYFSAFGLDWLGFFALPMSFILSAIEFSLGVCILLAVYRRFSTILLVLFMSFMTVLTLYLAIVNPVTDCGCFGDALVITNWQTFYKNLVLLAAAIILFLWYKKMTTIFSYKINWLVALYTYFFILSISFYCYQNLPILDFRPYKIGANIPNGMVIPEGVPADKNITTFIYERNGEQKEFTVDDAPINDSTWVFVDAKNIVIKGYQPVIHDFNIVTEDGIDITEDVLQYPGYTFLLISPKLEKAEESNVDRINELFDYTRQNGYKFYCICASSPGKITEWKNNAGADYPICTMDEITLKTIIRSNPGLLLLKEGTIYNKWHNNNIPRNGELNLPLEESSLGKIAHNDDVKEILVVFAIFLIPLLMLYLSDMKTRKLLHLQKRKK